MSMNGISRKLDQWRHLEAAENSDSKGYPEGLLVAQESSNSRRPEFRVAPQILVNLEDLKRKYNGCKSLGRRVAPRFALRLSVLVMSATASFRTETVDVS